MGKWCLQARSFIFYRIFIKLAGNQDRHKISDEFEFRPDRISHFGVTCPCGRIKFSVDILWNLQVQLTFQTVEFFVTLFLGTVSLEDWNLVQAWTGQVYHLYQNQAAALIIPLFLHFSFSPIFNIEIFCHTFARELWGLEDWKLIHMWTVGRCIMYTRIFLSNFQHWNFSSHFSQELWGLEDWNLVHT